MTETRETRIRILVVDDDSGSRNVVSETLQREGYDVEMAESADRALEKHSREEMAWAFLGGFGLMVLVQVGL